MPNVRPQPDPNQQWLSDISSGLNVVSGVERGGAAGDVQAGLGATKLASNVGAFGAASKQVNATVSGVGDVLGIYSGVKQGGVQGYGEAAVSTADLASRLGMTSENYAGYLAAPLAIYDFAETWQSGKTGSDALAGAEAGAAIGSIVGPVGTVVGAVIGGVVGAVSSAFGGGATDPETKNWQSFIDATGGANATPQAMQRYQNLPPQSAFNLLAGVMDIRDGRIPIVNAFGRMGETNLLNQMTSTINAAYQAGKIKPGSSPSDIYSQVVQPWLNSKGATITPETGGLQLQTVLTSLIGSWQNGSLTNKTVLDSGGQSDISLPTYAGTAAAKSPTAQQYAAAVTPILTSFPGGVSGSGSISSQLTMPGG